MRYEGFVSKISSRPAGRKGGFAYSFLLENTDGTDGPWIGFGFESPPFKEGDYISVEADKNAKGYLTYVKGTGQQIKNPPARASARVPAGSARGNGHSAGAAGTDDSDKNMAGGASSGNLQAAGDVADRQTQIVLQHSQEMAIAAVGVLLQHDALPMSEAKSKAGTAKRFDEVRAMIDKLTRKFYDDVVTGQLLKIVAPEIISTEPDGPLPEVATEQPRAAAKKVNVAPAEQAGVF